MSSGAAAQIGALRSRHRERENIMNGFGSLRGIAPASIVAAAGLLVSAAGAEAALPELWRLPGGTAERTYLTTSGDTQRGLAYNAGNNHLYVASRAAGNPGIFILNAENGADLGTLSTTGITGGTFAYSLLGTGSDGAIYAANLTTNAGAATTPFKVYRWASESAAPTLVYSGNPLGGTTAGRFGDSFDVTGSGTGALLAAGRGNSADPAGVALFNTTDGTTFSAVVSNPASTGNYRQSVTFGGPGELYGKESGDALRRGSFDGDLAYTEANSYPTANFASGIGPIDVDAGHRLLAALNTGSHAVSLWDVSDTANPPVLIDSAVMSGTLNANGNAAGQIVLDAAHNRIFVLDTNNGITALGYAVPEPGTGGLLAAGLLGLAARRRR
jgi:hypothetical protein